MISFFTDILQLFFPSLCVVCEKNLRYSEKILCTECLLDIPRIHLHNKNHNPLENLLWGLIPYTRASAFFYYSKKDPYARLLHDLKYKKQYSYGIFIGELFAHELEHAGFFESIDAIVPIPLHSKREHSRGYNQSYAIAEGISNISGIPIISNAVMRRVNTETQTKKNKEERQKNVANIFEVTSYTALENKHILLIDDVITTGSTCVSCAETILEQGFIKEISIACIGLAR